MLAQTLATITETLVCVAAKVIAIEPQPSCIRELRARFSSDNRITIVPVALGSENGTSELFLRQSRGSSGFVQEWDNRENIGSVSVPVRTLDEMIEAHGTPDYIKMDVEGFELPVIKGLSSKISLMSFEYRLSADDCAAKLEIIDLLSRFGRLQFNILPEGAGRFYWDQFVSSKIFFDTFPKKLAERAKAFLGDIFVRTGLGAVPTNPRSGRKAATQSEVGHVCSARLMVAKAPSQRASPRSVRPRLKRASGPAPRSTAARNGARSSYHINHQALHRLRSGRQMDRRQSFQLAFGDPLPRRSPG
jgi:FkbM family methyltransferase